MNYQEYNKLKLIELIRIKVIHKAEIIFEKQITQLSEEIKKIKI